MTGITQGTNNHRDFSSSLLDIPAFHNRRTQSTTYEEEEEFNTDMDKFLKSAISSVLQQQSVCDTVPENETVISPVAAFRGSAFSHQAEDPSAFPHDDPLRDQVTVMGGGFYRTYSEPVISSCIPLVDEINLLIPSIRPSAEFQTEAARIVSEITHLIKQGIHHEINVIPYGSMVTGLGVASNNGGHCIDLVVVVLINILQSYNSGYINRKNTILFSLAEGRFSYIFAIDFAISHVPFSVPLFLRLSSLWYPIDSLIRFLRLSTHLS